MTTKAALRQAYREKRMALSPGMESRLQDLLLIRFQQLPLPFVDTVHCYLPATTRKEPDPLPLARFMAFRNPALQLIVPVVNADRQTLSHVLLEADTMLELNNWGIPEPVDAQPADPSSAQLVFIPLLAFDRQGHRVGYGKGFYDRFLANLPQDILRIGLSFFDPVERITDTNTFDIRLHYCVTPEHLYAFE
jgi:5-formyltetrahydrofolate cyclo-ligase